jgi:hypothetical protein
VVLVVAFLEKRSDIVMLHGSDGVESLDRVNGRRGTVSTMLILLLTKGALNTF